MILAEPCDLVSCRHRSWGFHPPQGFSPLQNSTGLVDQRSPLGVRESRSSTPPSGVSVLRRSVPAVQSVSSGDRPMPSRAFYHFHGVLVFGLGPPVALPANRSSHSGSPSAPDLHRGSVVSSPKLVSSVFPPKPRHLPLSWAPAILAFLAFLAQSASRVARGRPLRPALPFPADRKSVV